MLFRIFLNLHAFIYAHNMEEKVKQRIALGTFFFLSGLTFATWASRIPTLKTFFDLNEAELGTILLAMPISSLIGLPISGWLVSKFDSRKPMLVGFLLFNVTLIWIGFVQTTLGLIVAISFFSFFMRILNIAINTQSIIVQRNFEKRIVGSFHGLWSTGGLVGVAISTLMVKMNIGIGTHLMSVSIFTTVLIIIAFYIR